MNRYINSARNSLIAAITIYCNVNQAFGWGEDRSGICAFIGAIIVASYDFISYGYGNYEDRNRQLIAPTPPRTTIQDATTSDEPAHYSGRGYHLL
ncbi:hypothetical protein N8772_02675 [Rickettsiales bacterium]|nr:hypothetical protein [Rickettsiales bacterium]MDB2550590.1 hypothetical protein [Rickettsiales bacterium]